MTSLKNDRSNGHQNELAIECESTSHRSLFTIRRPRDYTDINLLSGSFIVACTRHLNVSRHFTVTEQILPSRLCYNRWWKAPGEEKNRDQCRVKKHVHNILNVFWHRVIMSIVPDLC